VIHDASLREIRKIIASEPPQRAAARVVEVLHSQFPHYSWVGIYWVRGTDLVLGPWKGPEATQHTRIPIGTGVCGAAALSGKTEIVADVSRDARYLACFASTKSEIVVPIHAGGKVVGEIDIDGKELGAFSRRDQVFLEGVAQLLGPLYPASSEPAAPPAVFGE
jgi:L-methionine (R)-S-oxide reductase